VTERQEPLEHAWPLLERLASGESATGEALGEALGLTRAAIWKQVDQLRRAGLAVSAAAGSGYALETPLELLDADRIADLLRSEHQLELPSLTVLRSVASTNRWLQERSEVQGAVCLAETQTDGRGRRGRSWYSPLGAGLLLSQGWRFADQPAAIGCLSLVVGLACTRALEMHGVDGVELKWPNDLVYRGAKLGGILVEMRGEAHGAVELVIGVGINHRLPSDDLAGVEDRSVIDLAKINTAPPSRNALVASLIAMLQAALTEFGQTGFDGFAESYRARDALAGTQVQVEGGERAVIGDHAGIGDDGALLVQTDTGLQRIYAGEVSVRITQ
jgi:BirA family transcriptional regulator, biotin operon repressor / biotin---[acetyl-CoA-carboxylase] ligase